MLGIGLLYAFRNADLVSATVGMSEAVTDMEHRVTDNGEETTGSDRLLMLTVSSSWSWPVISRHRKLLQRLLDERIPCRIAVLSVNLRNPLGQTEARAPAMFNLYQIPPKSPYMVVKHIYLSVCCWIAPNSIKSNVVAHFRVEYERT